VRLEVTVTSGPGQVVAFGSGIANRSNDPVDVRDELPGRLAGGENPGGGLSSVSHDGTLQATAPLLLPSGSPPEA